VNSQQLDRAKELALEGKSDLSHADVEHLDDGTIRFKLWPKGLKAQDQTDASSIKDVRISKTGQVLPLRRGDL
jgi:hypothetical protein